MGSRNPDRVPLAYRRRKCETVQQMIEQRWEVLAKCDKCDKCELLTRVDLCVVAKVRGPTFSLWNRRSRCRRVGCTGVVCFQAKAPGMNWHDPLEAPWPGG
jgi:hypothetical protein